MSYWVVFELYYLHGLFVLWLFCLRKTVNDSKQILFLDGPSDLEIAQCVSEIVTGERE